MNNHQLLRESLRREWKGLRKFNSHGQLQRSGFVENPPYLDRNWTDDDRMDRLDIQLPLLSKNRDMLWVDDYYHIAVDAASPSESEGHRAPMVYSPLPRSPKTP